MQKPFLSSVNPALHSDSSPIALGVLEVGALLRGGGCAIHCFDNLTAITKINVTIATQPKILNTSGLAI